MAATTRNAGEPYFELMDLDDLKKWPGNPKRHDFGFLAEVFKTNGVAEFPTIDEGTGKMVAGHGRRDKLIAMRAAGEPPPARIKVRKGKWLVPVIRGMTFAEPAKHVVASNRGPELGGNDNGLLAAFLQRIGSGSARTTSSGPASTRATSRAS